MKTLKTNRVLTFLGALAVAACDDGAPTAPVIEELFTLAESMELEVLEIGNGTHHFGFLVNDEWFVPDDAPDVVPDEWGRHSATLVIEGVGS